MTKNRSFWTYPLFSMGMLLMITNSCKNDDPVIIKDDLVIIKDDIVINWSNPSDIISGTMLSATQLNATADVTGTFVYTPPIGTKLSVGENQNLTVCFTPKNAVNYNSATKTVTINVVPATVSDIDGNVYNTVVIGTQVWLVENLKTTKYRDGTVIPNVTDKTIWKDLTTGAFGDYENTPSNSDTYGKLYNWYAATDVHNIAPTGWHVPTDAEWKTLTTTYLGSSNYAGSNLKEIGNTHWASPNQASNLTGFTALPGGYRYMTGDFTRIGESGYWWTATEYNASSALYRSMFHNGSSVNEIIDSKKLGASIRCIKD